MRLSIELASMIKNMTFGTALDFMRQGYAVSSASWKEDYCVFLKGNKFYRYDEGNVDEWDIESRYLLLDDYEFYLGEGSKKYGFNNNLVEDK